MLRDIVEVAAQDLHGRGNKCETTKDLSRYAGSTWMLDYSFASLPYFQGKVSASHLSLGVSSDFFGGKKAFAI